MIENHDVLRIALIAVIVVPVVAWAFYCYVRKLAATWHDEKRKSQLKLIRELEGETNDGQ